jgi:outer membrane lipoprotein SlyB
MPVAKTQAGRFVMKKLLATLLCLIVLTVAAMPVGAQTRYRRNSTYATQQQRRYDYNGYDNRSVWEQHRDKITTAGGALGGAVLGGLLGGKKGAVIGAITGGAGAAVYTYKIRNNHRY